MLTLSPSPSPFEIEGEERLRRHFLDLNSGIVKGKANVAISFIYVYDFF